MDAAFYTIKLMIFNYQDFEYNYYNNTSFLPKGIKTYNKSGVKYFSNGIHVNISENTFVTASYSSSEFEVF